MVLLLLGENGWPVFPFFKSCVLPIPSGPFIANLQALNAMGRSDIFLKLEIVKDGGPGSSGSGHTL